MFLQETHLNFSRMERIKFGFNFVNYLAVSNEGRGGGLALLWKSHIDLTILQHSKSYIHVVISSETQDNRHIVGFFLEFMGSLLLLEELEPGIC